MEKINMEIERKFLVNKPIENYKDCPCREIEQAYLSLVPEIRVRRDNDDYYLTYKSSGELSREEYNLSLTQDAYNHLLKKADGNIISKRRYVIPIKHSELVVELDIFEGKFDGLILAEVEFETVYDANNFVPPYWFGIEVTCDDRYKNKNLAKQKENSRMRRFGHLSDEQLYMLSRSTIESICCITMGVHYTDEQQEIHCKLMNELLLERKERDYNNAKQLELVERKKK